MRVTEIRLWNFRGFRGENIIPVHSELCVLIGVNGAGKSSLLDAVGSNLSAVISVVAGENEAWFAGGDAANVHNGATSAEWGVSLQDISGSKSEELKLFASTDIDACQKWDEDTEDALFPFLQKLGERRSDLSFILPYLGYIHSSSTRAPESYIAGGELLGRLSAYSGAFDSESVQFDALSAWFELEENLENQEKIRTWQFGYELESLKAVRTAVQRFLSTLHGCKLGKLAILRSHGRDPLAPPKGRLVIDKDSHTLFIEQLSDGERRLVLLVADVARRMVVLNPRLPDALESPGILLIDEIELHLHPQWQRTVVPALRNAFPKLQFLLATHAPTVLATVPNECIVVLENGHLVPGKPSVFGRDPNTILSTEMDTPLRPDAIQQDLDKLFEDMDGHPRRAKTTLKKLEALLGEDDPELVRARALMKFMAS